MSCTANIKLVELSPPVTSCGFLYSRQSLKCTAKHASHKTSIFRFPFLSMQRNRFVGNARPMRSIKTLAIGDGTTPDSFMSFEEAGLIEMAVDLDMHEKFLARLTVSSLNLLRKISDEEGCAIEDLNAGKVTDWFSKDSQRKKDNPDEAILKW
mmetsp:Transcript_29490/g.40723  ORF Transcript_29490/g.40723 Transcript_29490/m.40723 type:complete len:153 (+) Transcript_29490:116-574(+)